MTAVTMVVVAVAAAATAAAAMVALVIIFTPLRVIALSDVRMQCARE